MHNKPGQRPPRHTHCHDKQQVIFEAEYDPKSDEQFAYIKVPFKSGRLLLEEDLIDNYIRKNGLDEKGKQIVEKVEGLLQYSKRPTYVKPKSNKEIKIGKVAVKKVDPITGKVTYEIQDNIPSGVLEEIAKEATKEVIKDNEFITYGDIKDVLDKDMDRVYARLTALESTMTVVLRILHYLQNGVLPPFKDKIELPRPGDVLQDVTDSMLPPLTDYVPPYTEDKEEKPSKSHKPKPPKEEEEENKVINIIIESGGKVIPIYPEVIPDDEDETEEDENEEGDVDSSDTEEKEEIVEPKAHVEIPDFDPEVDDIVDLRVIVNDPNNEWNKLTLLVKTPSNDYYTSAGILKETKPQPEGYEPDAKHMVVYYTPKEEGVYLFKLVHYVNATEPGGGQTEIAVDIYNYELDHYELDVYAREEPLPEEKVTIEKGVDDTDIRVGDPLSYRFIINRYEDYRETGQLVIKKPKSIVSITEDLEFSIYEGRISSTLYSPDFDVAGQWEFELKIDGIDTKKWFIEVKENNIPEEENEDIDNNGSSDDRDEEEVDDDGEDEKESEEGKDKVD